MRHPRARWPVLAVTIMLLAGSARGVALAADPSSGSIDLDLGQSMHVESIKVDGEPAGPQQLQRELIGDDLCSVLRTLARDHDDGDASTIDLIDLAEDVSGQQLDLLLRAWLYAPEKPVDW